MIVRHSTLVSIITVTYNAQKTILDSLASVKGQKNIYEYIIVDGNSTDMTLNLIKQFEGLNIHLISEPDKGIYDAMNKGIDIATGDYLYFLGSDDKFAYEGVLADIEHLIQDDRPDLILGNIIYDSGLVVRPRFNYTMLLHNAIHHQGTFYNRRLFNEFRYNLNYRIIADYELNLSIYLRKNDLNLLLVNRDIALCGEGGASRTGKKLFVKETNLIRNNYIKGIGGMLLKYVFLCKFHFKDLVEKFRQ